MLAASQFHIPSSSSYAYLPAIPSPLSPRSANIHGRHPRDVHMSSSAPIAANISESDNARNAPKGSKTGSGSENQSPNVSSCASNVNTASAASNKPVPFSQRSIKKAPPQQAGRLQENRRNAFLCKVRDTRDEKRYEARAEDMMRLDFMRRQRELEAEFARSAPDFPMQEEEEGQEEEDEVFDLPVWSQLGDSQMALMPSQHEIEEDWAGEFERAEEEAMLALMESKPEDQESLWSDDTDYDALFGHFSDNGERQQGGGDEMDMS